MRFNDTPPRESQRVTATDGAMALIVVLLITQVWLLASTLNSFLAGHRDVAIPAAIASGLLFAACAALYRFVVRLERRP
jgi:predicted Co/Zn/Cd cation transporter (cation efflux family)